MYLGSAIGVSHFWNICFILINRNLNVVVVTKISAFSWFIKCFSLILANKTDNGWTEMCRMIGLTLQRKIKDGCRRKVTNSFFLVEVQRFPMVLMITWIRCKNLSQQWKMEVSGQHLIQAAGLVSYILYKEELCNIPEVFFLEIPLVNPNFCSYMCNLSIYLVNWIVFFYPLFDHIILFYFHCGVD